MYIYYMCTSVYIAYIIIFTDQNEMELVESEMLEQLYKDIQNELPIDELLPQLVTNKIITINDKILITEFGKNINERTRFFLDQYIEKPLSAGDPVSFYKLLQIMDTSVKCSALVTKIKRSLMIASLQDKISGKEL